MATLYSQQSINVQKTWVLMALFLVGVIGLGYFLSFTFNNPVIVYVAVVFSLGMNFFSYWYSDKIVLKMTKAVPANRELHRELYRVVENLSITAGLPIPRIYIIPDRTLNAFATGRDQAHAVVAVTQGLLAKLDKNELEGVIAHELAHIGNRDILLSTVIVVLVGFVSLLADFFWRFNFFGSGDREGRGNIIFLIIGVALLVLSPIVATIIQLAISRKREFLADATGALLTRYPEGLASALEKISAENVMPMKHTSQATAHLYIASPFGTSGFKGLNKLFMTHPSVEERIKILRGLQM